MTRTFSEIALCHLPADEIRMVLSDITKAGMTVAYSNDAGFFIWKQANVENCPILTQILSTQTTDYVLFDVDVDPDPELEIFDDV
jgi:hypothetical protein